MIIQSVEALRDLDQGTSAYKLTKYDNARFCIVGQTLYILGTDDWKDIKQNLNLNTVVNGFHAGYYQHMWMIKRWLDERNMCVGMVVGHSMGAAVAEIMSYEFGIPCISVNPPKYTVCEMTKSSEIIRIVNLDDIVPRLPRWFKLSRKFPFLKFTTWYHIPSGQIDLGKKPWFRFWVSKKAHRLPSVVSRLKRHK